MEKTNEEMRRNEEEMMSRGRCRLISWDTATMILYVGSSVIMTILNKVGHENTTAPTLLKY